VKGFLGDGQQVAAAPAVAGAEAGDGPQGAPAFDEVVGQAALVGLGAVRERDRHHVPVRPEVVDVPPLHLVAAEVPPDAGQAVSLRAAHVGVDAFL